MIQSADFAEIREQAISAFVQRDFDAFKGVIAEWEHQAEETTNYQIELRAQNDELRLVRQELEISNIKYRNLYDFSPAAFITFDEDFHIIALNRTAANLLDFKIKELIGKSFSDFIFPDDQDNFYLHCKSAISVGHTINCKVRVVSSSGKVISLNGESKCLKNIDKIEIHSSFTDVTELDQTRNMVEEQEKLFQKLFDKAGDANYILDGDIYLDCNARALELFGLDSKTEIIGWHPYDFSPKYQFCGKNSIDKAKEYIELCYERGYINFEWQHINKKTGLILTEVTLTAITRDGQPLLLVTLRDISERKAKELELKKSQANLYTIIDSSNIAIALFSNEGLLLHFNQLFSNGVGQALGKEIRINFDYEYLVTDSTDEHDLIYYKNKVLCGEPAKFEKSLTINGELRHYEFNYNPVVIDELVEGFCIFISDISKYKYAEQVLKESNEELEQKVEERANALVEQAKFLSLLMDSIADLIFVKDVDGKYLNCNIAYCSFTGREKSELLGKTDYDLYSAEDAESFTEFDRRMFETGKSARSNQVLTFPDGSKLIFDTIKTPLFDQDGNIKGLIGISRDITEFKKLEDDIKNINRELEDIIDKRTVKLQQEISERIRAEEALKKSREMYRNLFNDIPVGIYRTTLDGSIILANPALVSMLGYNTLNELKARDLNTHGYADAKSREDFISLVLSSEKTIEFEGIWITKTGEELFVLEKAKVVRDYRNNVMYIEGTAEDISDRKIAEKMQQTVYRISEMAYKVNNLEELYPFIHKSINALLPCRNFYIAIYDELRNEISFPYLVDEIESPEPSKLGPYPFNGGMTEYVISTGTFHLLHKEQIVSLERQGLLQVSGPMPESWLGVPLKTTDNRSIGVLAVQSYDEGTNYDVNAKDILVFISTQIAMVIYRKQIEEALHSERKYLADRVLERTEELSALNAELERAVRTKDEFLANMSHELRTPLNAILGLSEILLKHKEFNENEKHKRAMNTIRESGSHLLNLINDILDLSKIEAGKLDINYEELNVMDIANASINFVRQLAIKKSIDIELEVAPRTPSVFHADSVRIKQILINLLNNAVKFTPQKGKVGLHISIDSKEEVIYFNVWDTGIGMSDENLQKLFKPFTQLSSNLAREYEGTGLGLSLVSKLSEMHGGSVSVESKVGIGSKFIIAIPIRNQRMQQNVFDTITDRKFNNIQNVLIIEDSPDDANLLAGFLSKFSIIAELFEFEANIEEVLNEKRYDVVFLDLLLWDKSGWEILNLIKKHPKLSSIPVVVTSVLKERARASAYGADAYLVKPYSFNTLYESLQRIDLKYDKGLFLEKQAEGSKTPMENQTLILLAEDNEANLQTLETFLEYGGFSVVVARNGKEAVDTAFEYQPDLILMDIQMPKMDGLEAIRLIKQNNRFESIPIIALTALAMPGDRERCLSAGANNYVSKPVNFDTLINSMNELLPEDKRKISE